LDPHGQDHSIFSASFDGRTILASGCLSAELHLSSRCTLARPQETQTGAHPERSQKTDTLIMVLLSERMIRFGQRLAKLLTLPRFKEAPTVLISSF
jgi:hypothetical protein